MKIYLKRLNDAYHFETRNERGHIIHLDNKSASDDPKGASPMELLLMGIAGCSGIDMVMILSKQHVEIKDLQMEVVGTRKGADAVPNTFTGIHLKVSLEGDMTANKAQRAADLSFEKYCSVAKMLEQAADITYEVHLNGELIN